MELKRFEDARNAFGRAVDADADFAAAHYNLSFVLSQLGDFDGALRETRRALELEPLYVPQKFALTIDLQYEDPTIAIAPELVADVSGEELAGEFSFDSPALDRLFEELAPAEPAPSVEPADDLAPAGARSHQPRACSIWLAAELDRAAARGAPRHATAVLLGDIFAKRGSAWRGARAVPGGPSAGSRRLRRHPGRDPRAARARSGTGRGRPLADELAARVPRDADVLAARARVRLAMGDCRRGARVRSERRSPWLRAGPTSSISRRRSPCAWATVPPRSPPSMPRLELDPSLVRVWYELGAMEEERRNWAAARAAYERALDLLPTYGTAALALADLIRRTESPRAAIPVLVRVLETDPYELEALTALGRALLEDGRTDQALEAFTRVLRFDPEHAAALYHQGTCFARQRQFDHAVQVWERVIQLGPGRARSPPKPGAGRDPRAICNTSSRRRAEPWRSKARSRNSTSRTSSSCWTSAGRAAYCASRPSCARRRGRCRSSGAGSWRQRSAAIRSRSVPGWCGMGKISSDELERARALQASGDSRRLGDILVASGVIARRELDRQLKAQIEEAIFELLGWSEGYFRFEDGAAVRGEWSRLRSGFRPRRCSWKRPGAATSGPGSRTRCRTCGWSRGCRRPTRRWRTARSGAVRVGGARRGGRTAGSARARRRAGALGVRCCPDSLRLVRPPG